MLAKQSHYSYVRSRLNYLDAVYLFFLLPLKKNQQAKPLYVHLDCDDGHPPATAIIIREADKKPKDCKLSILFENPLTSKCWLVDVRLTEKPSGFLGECLNAMFHPRMCISNSLHQQLKKKKKRHFDASFIYVIFPTHD